MPRRCEPEAETGALHRLSAGDPVVACTAGGTAGQVTAHATESPFVAVNPADPRQSIVTWAQDSWSAPGGARAAVYAYTRDGVHFTEGVLPFGACAGAGSVSPGFGRVDLPRVSWGPDGVAYAVATEIDFTTGASGNGVAASFDGGATWSTPALISADPKTPAYDWTPSPPGT